MARQIIGYRPDGTPIYADPAFGTAGGVGASPADMAFAGSPSAAATPAALSAPDAMNTPWQTQAPLGGPAGTGMSASTGQGYGPVDPTNVGSGGGTNALGLLPNSYAQGMANPDLMSAAYNMNTGAGPNSGTAALNSQYGNNLNYLYLISQGNAALGGSANDYFNWANNAMQQGNTPGGSYVSEGQVLNALFSTDPKNPIYQNIYAVDSNGQAPTPDKVVNRFIGIMQAGLQSSTPPMVINALTSMYAQSGKEYQVLLAQGKLPPNMSFTDYLRSKGEDPQSLGVS